MVKNRVRNDSDIDIAILTDKQIDEYKLFMVSQQLADKLNREVNIVDLRKISTLFKAETLRTGKLIYNFNNKVKMTLIEARDKNSFQVNTKKKVCRSSYQYSVKKFNFF